MKFSLCMIVKNEERVLARCLDSLKDVMDEIIIVDTGSSDRTRRIAAEYTDLIYDFARVDDFSAARKFAFSKATGDYIYSADADEYLDEENQAKALMEQIKNGEIPFEKAAMQYSKCPSSAQGGSLGEFGRGQMVPEFDAACFDMEKGELRGPIKTQFGYHIIRLDDKKEAQPLHFSDVREAIKRQLTIEKQQAAYRSKVNQLKILFPVDQF